MRAPRSATAGGVLLLAGLLGLGALELGCDGVLGIGGYTFGGTASASSSGGATGDGGGAGASGSTVTSSGSGGGGAGGTSATATGGGGASCDGDGDGHRAIACGGDDCDDGDRKVHPGQMSYFTEPAAGGGYDYDCDGNEQKQFASAGCSSLSLVNCDSSHVGLEIDLACGQTGAWGHCTNNLTSCAFTQDSQKTQACR